MANKTNEELTLEEMHQLNKRAESELATRIGQTKGIEIVHDIDGAVIKFHYKGHTFVFTAEVEE